MTITSGMGERGFTLIEVLVVIVIVGILAAIALPTFIGQKAKANDASAKTDVRNAISQMESCLVTDLYAACEADADVLQSGVSAELGGSATSYTLTKVSPSPHATDFNIIKSGPGAFNRTCGTTIPAGRGQGSCPSTGSW